MLMFELGTYGNAGNVELSLIVGILVGLEMHHFIVLRSMFSRGLESSLKL